jgi:hypothetical protein
MCLDLECVYAVIHKLKVRRYSSNWSVIYFVNIHCTLHDMYMHYALHYRYCQYG